MSRSCEHIFKWYDYTVFQLKSVAKANNIRNFSKMKKTDLIRKLHDKKVPVPANKPAKQKRKPGKKQNNQAKSKKRTIPLGRGYATKHIGPRKKAKTPPKKSKPVIKKKQHIQPEEEMSDDELTVSEASGMERL